MTRLIDVDSSKERYSSVCAWCSNWQRGERACKAFRDGSIPLAIWDGDNDHREPYPGDNGIRFERLEL